MHTSLVCYQLYVSRSTELSSSARAIIAIKISLLRSIHPKRSHECLGQWGLRCLSMPSSCNLYGGLHRKSWTSEDHQQKVSHKFGLWHDHLRFTVAILQRIIALNMDMSMCFWRLFGVLSHQLTCRAGYRRPEFLVQTFVLYKDFDESHLSYSSIGLLPVLQDFDA